MKTQILKEHYIPNIHAITNLLMLLLYLLVTTDTKILINNLVELIS